MQSQHKQHMEAAWNAASNSECLKKKCGAALVLDGKVIFTGYGGREGACSVCMRDTGEVFYSDGCWSVHAEMRAVVALFKSVDSHDYMQRISDIVCYVTHGPCDACLKLLDYVGIRTVVYDEPYKTDYTHWPRITVLGLNPDGTVSIRNEMRKL